MPGFIQSIKSHLPHSPFSPTKKNENVPLPEVVVPAEQVISETEQPTSEVLPGESLVSHNSSTVALSLTPVNGESSHQLTLGSSDPFPSDDVNQLLNTVSQIELDPIERTDCVEPVEEASEPMQEEVTPVTSQEAVPPVINEPEHSEDVQSECTAAEHLPVPEADIPTESEDVQPTPSQPEDEIPTSDEVVKEVENASAEQVVLTGDSTEIPLEATPSVPEAVAINSPTKSGKENFSCLVKRAKSKKSKASPDTAEVTDAPVKPRKSNPLAGKFRNVIDQVRSKVKKDKDLLVKPPVVTVIEPMPISEDTVTAA